MMVLRSMRPAAAFVAAPVSAGTFCERPVCQRGSKPGAVANRSWSVRGRASRKAAVRLLRATASEKDSSGPRIGPAAAVKTLVLFTFRVALVTAAAAAVVVPVAVGSNYVGPFIDRLNEIPILPEMLECLGLTGTIYLTWRYLLTRDGREELGEASEKIQAFFDKLPF